MSAFLDCAITAARIAGDLQLDYLGKNKDIQLKDFDESKGPINLVTLVDTQSEALIIETIRASFTDHDILTEETDAHRTDSKYRWIIDPLDGTTNYAHDFPLFCVSIALEKAGEVIMGVVYAPFYDELFFAERGTGAFLNERPIRVSKTPHLAHSILTTGFPYDRRDRMDYYMEYFKSFMRAAQAIRRCGAAALDLCFLACGRTDGFWEINLAPWDTAAGGLILHEAGGITTDFAGKPFNPYIKQIAASNKLIHPELIATLQSVITTHGEAPR